MQSQLLLHRPSHSQFLHPPCLLRIYTPCVGLAVPVISVRWMCRHFYLFQLFFPCPAEVGQNATTLLLILYFSRVPLFSFASAVFSSVPTVESGWPLKSEVVESGCPFGSHMIALMAGFIHDKLDHKSEKNRRIMGSRIVDSPPSISWKKVRRVKK